MRISSFATHVAGQILVTLNLSCTLMLYTAVNPLLELISAIFYVAANSPEWPINLFQYFLLFSVILDRQLEFSLPDSRKCKLQLILGSR